MLKDWDIYAKQLATKGYGFPLFYPEHPNEEGHGPAEIGDVGIIENGRFVPYFNVVNEKSPLNVIEPTPKFERLKFSPRLRVQSQNRIYGPASISSQTEERSSIEGSGNVGEYVDTSSSSSEFWLANTITVLLLAR